MPLLSVEVSISVTVFIVSINETVEMKIILFLLRD